MALWTSLAVVTGLRLHEVSWVFSLVGCFCALLGGLVLWWKTRAITLPTFGSLQTMLSSNYRPGLAGLNERMWKVNIILFAIALVFDLDAFQKEFYRPEIVTMSNVHVLAQSLDDPLTFTMDVYNPVKRERAAFTASFCPNSQLTPEIQPGVTLGELDYIEDTHQRCFDVRAPHTGYIIERDNHHVPTRISFTGPSAAHNP